MYSRYKPDPFNAGLEDTSNGRWYSRSLTMKRKNYSGRSTSPFPYKRSRRLTVTAPPRSYRAPSRVYGRSQQLELKGVDTDLSFAAAAIPATTNGNTFMQPLNIILQGAGSWQRVGRKVKAQSVRVFGVLRHDEDPATSTGDQTGNTVRMAIVWDKQPSGAAIPNFDTIFGVTGNDGTESSSVLDPVRYDNMSRFQILWNKKIDCHVMAGPANAGTTVVQGNTYSFDEYIKLNNRESVYATSTNSIADISTGALYFIVRAQYQGASNQCYLLDSTRARLRYVD